MRVTFKQHSPDYVGDYIVELQKAGLLKIHTREETKELRNKLKTGNLKEISDHYFSGLIYGEKIDLENMIEQKRSDFDRNRKQVPNFEEIIQRAAQFERFINRIAKVKYISVDDYLKIENVLDSKENGKQKKNNEDMGKDFFPYLKDANLKKYINAFCYMVAYAKKYCFKTHSENVDKIDRVISKEERKRIRNFFYDIATGEGLDIDCINIKYNGRKNLNITSPILIKMAIYEFARRYFRLIEGEKESSFLPLDKKDHAMEKNQDLINYDLLEEVLENENENETWEKSIKSYSQYKRGRNFDHDKFNKIALISIYMFYIEHIQLFKERTPKKYKYQLLCRLLVIAGLDDFYHKTSTFDNEADHFAHQIQIILRTNQKEKTIQKKPK